MLLKYLHTPNKMFMYVVSKTEVETLKSLSLLHGEFLNGLLIFLRNLIRLGMIINVV